MSRVPLIPRRRMLLVTAFALTPFLAVTTPGRGQEPSPGSSAIDQYVEALPTGSGPSVPGVTKEKRTPLPRKAKEALRKAPSSSASALEKIATSTSYGAPEKGAGPGARERDLVPASTSARAAMWRSIDAAATGSDARLLGLVALLLAISITAGGLAVGRTRA